MSKASEGAARWHLNFLTKEIERFLVAVEEEMKKPLDDFHRARMTFLFMELEAAKMKARWLGLGIAPRRDDQSSPPPTRTE